eukprot:15670752-Heterocapsa_arctica.AAC.1
MGTCKGQSGWSTIEFFVIEGNLAKGVKEVTTVIEVEPRPHRPVRMSITPPTLPNVRMVGPSRKPPEWSGMQQSTTGVKKCIASCTPAEGAKLLDKAYASWARLAGIELQGITGSDIRLGHRASKPVL